MLTIGIETYIIRQLGAHIFAKCFARLRLDRGNNYNAETEKKCDECDVPLNSTHLLTECTKSMSNCLLFQFYTKFELQRCIVYNYIVIVN